MNSVKPPLWALDRAAGIAGIGEWYDVENYHSDEEAELVRLHAVTLAKYEDPPNNPDYITWLRELVAVCCEAVGAHGVEQANKARGGQFDDGSSFQAGLAYIKTHPLPTEGGAR